MRPKAVLRSRRPRESELTTVPVPVPVSGYPAGYGWTGLLWMALSVALCLALLGLLGVFVRGSFGGGAAVRSAPTPRPHHPPLHLTC
jgi:hypothetical protein